ncbi:MAG: hypothetical protein KA165_00945, partial [Saprospiraceae bacterium]|nr:hypothetical protein [Saprospiraceae bacterium]
PLSFLAKKADKAFWRTLDDLHPTQSKFLTALNAAGNPGPAVRYSLLGGNLEMVSQNGADNYWVRLRKFATKAALDHLVFDGPHDMAVEVESQKGTRWLKPDHTAVVGVDHLSYFVEKEGLEAFERLLTESWQHSDNV